MAEACTPIQLSSATTSIWPTQEKFLCRLYKSWKHGNLGTSTNMRAVNVCLMAKIYQTVNMPMRIRIKCWSVSFRVLSSGQTKQKVSAEFSPVCTSVSKLGKDSYFEEKPQHPPQLHLTWALNFVCFKQKRQSLLSSLNRCSFSSKIFWIIWMRIISHQSGLFSLVFVKL